MMKAQFSHLDTAPLQKISMNSSRNHHEKLPHTHAGSKTCRAFAQKSIKAAISQPVLPQTIQYLTLPASTSQGQKYEQQTRLLKKKKTFGSMACQEPLALTAQASVYKTASVKGAVYTLTRQKKKTTSELASRGGYKTFDCEMPRVEQCEGLALSRPRMLNVAATHSATQLKTMALSRAKVVPVVHYKLQQSQTCRENIGSVNTSQVLPQQSEPRLITKTASSNKSRNGDLRNPPFRTQGLYRSLREAVRQQKTINREHKQTCLLGSHRFSEFKTERKMHERQPLSTSINLTAGQRRSQQFDHSEVRQKSNPAKVEASRQPIEIVVSEVPTYPNSSRRSERSSKRQALEPQFRDNLGMIDEEEAMPLRPLTRGQQAPGATTLFGNSEEGHSEVCEQSVRDEMNDTGVLELIYGIRQENIGQVQSQIQQPGSSFFQTPLTNKVAGPMGGQGQQQNNIFGSPQVNPPKVFSAEYVSKLELRHQKEREQDQAKIANLERYIEQIHGEFSKNKELMQMLVAKCETEQNLQTQVNDLRMSLLHTPSVKKDEKAVQTSIDKNAEMIMQDMTTQEDVQAYSSSNITLNNKSDKKREQAASQLIMMSSSNENEIN